MNLYEENESKPWSMENPKYADKSFKISGPLSLEVDYDDVNHDAVDLLAAHLVELLNRWWSDVRAWHCENEDCEEYLRPVARSYRPNEHDCEACGQHMRLDIVSE